MTLPESELVYDWNAMAAAREAPRRHVELDDETLRDGLQSAAVRHPTIGQKIEIVHGLVALGVEAIDLGLPAAGAQAARDVERLAQEIAAERLPIAPNCAARTVVGDIRPIAEISQRTGQSIEVACFIGSSVIRRYAEGWDLDRLVRLTEEAVSFAVAAGLPVMYVTEDTTRATPEDLRRLFGAAIAAGARRVCIADTVGHSTPEGARAVTRFVRDFVDSTAPGVKVDWHGHNDRGLAVANALAAAAAGADRLHGSLLGLGERVGNTPLDQLLVNTWLAGWREGDLSTLATLCEEVAAVTGVPVPETYPVVGRDAFRTATGTHAAAIVKARAKGAEWLADRIYSSVPAALVGRQQIIEIGPMSGESNAVYWLTARGLPVRPDLVAAIVRRAKESTAVLRDAELLDLCRTLGVVPAKGREERR